MKTNIQRVNRQIGDRQIERHKRQLYNRYTHILRSRYIYGHMDRNRKQKVLQINRQIDFWTDGQRSIDNIQREREAWIDRKIGR